MFCPPFAPARRATLLGLAALAASSAPLLAQGPSAGFQTTTEPHPLALNVFSTLTVPLSGGDLLTFDGRFVERRDAAGAPLATLFDVGQDVFGAFLLLAPDESFALLSESTDGNLYRIDLQAGTGSLQDFVPGAYAAAFEPSGALIVSAATASFSLNDIVRVDLDQPGSGYQILAVVPGASGPIAALPNGDLVYGIPPSFSSTTPGEADLVRFAAGDLGTGILGLADSTPFATGFDGAGDLRYEAGCDCLYLAENSFGLGVARIRRVVPPSAALSPVLYDDPAGRTVSFSALAPPTAPGQLAPWQPAAVSGSITFAATDFFTSDERLTLRPLRPTAGFSQPGAGGAGTTDFSVTDGPANGFLVLAFAAPVGGPELPLGIPGQSPALFTGLDLAQVGVLPTLFALNGAGGFSATVQSALLPAGLAFQGLVYGGNPLAPLGTTTVALP